jgi:hypothetical protein
MYVIIDECFGAYQFREFFEKRGHHAEGVGRRFREVRQIPRSSPLPETRRPFSSRETTITKP